MAFDVVGIGRCCVDYLALVDRYPDCDSKTELGEFSMQGGGPVATALVTLAQFGVTTSFVGKVSDDDFGSFIQQGLREAGVDLRGLITSPGFVSPFSFIAVEKSSGRRTIFWTRGDVPALEAEEVDLEILQGARFLHVDGHTLQAQLRAARYAREHGVTVVFDGGSARTGWKELVSQTDVLVASERFAAEVGTGSLSENLKTLHAMGPRTVVITIGNEGSVGMENDETYLVPALQAQVVDTTGAGDVYHGAFVYGMLKGWNLRERMAFASTAAGLSCRSLGGRAGIPSLEEVHEAL